MHAMLPMNVNNRTVTDLVLRYNFLSPPSVSRPRRRDRGTSYLNDGVLYSVLRMARELDFNIGPCVGIGTGYALS